MTRAIHWFRNDLRLRDNTALRELLDRAQAWLPVFVVDPRLWGVAGPARQRFLRDCLDALRRALAGYDVPLLVREGRPEAVLPRLLDEAGAELLTFNEDTTPFARARDARVRRAVERAGVRVLVRRDRVVFGGDEIRSGSGGPYAVYTPYRNAWWKRWNAEPRRPQRRPAMLPAIAGFRGDDPLPAPAAEAAGLDLPSGGEEAGRARLSRFLEDAVRRYDVDRDRPDRDGTSRLSPYLRFGAVSARECIAAGEEVCAAEPGFRRGVSRWLDELVWREFYAAILEAHPRVLRENHRREYDDLVWDDDPDAFAAWCGGRTGFPIVDAGMRQLRATGWMHNRVRMIVASFLTKDLGIHWREGERWFFERLVDGDPASNNGGWQWAASTGTDAQPWFRIFNPSSQAERHDPEGRYVRRWIPELGSGDYPPPIVDHAERRARALARYEAVRNASRERREGDDGRKGRGR